MIEKTMPHPSLDALEELARSGEHAYLPSAVVLGLVHDSRIAAKAERTLDFIREKCKVIYRHEDSDSVPPVVHNPCANLHQWDAILALVPQATSMELVYAESAARRLACADSRVAAPAEPEGARP